MTCTADRRIDPNFITEHQVLTVGTHNAGQNMRAEREEERFSLIGAQKTRRNRAGTVSRRRD